MISVLFLTGCASQTETLVEVTNDVANDLENEVLETTGIDLVEDVEEEVPVDENMEARPIVIEAFNYEYSLKEIMVKKGEKIKLIIENIDGFHDLKIDELNIDSGRFERGETREVEFFATKSGEFEFYCSVGNHRERGMFGTLIIE